MQNIEERIKELEQEIKTSFEQTKLVTNVKIKGNLYNAENPLHLEYKIEENNDSRKKQAEVRLLRSHLIKKLIFNFSEIKEIKREVTEYGIYREYLITQMEISAIEEPKLRYQVLQGIKKEIENYLMQRKHEK